MLQTPISTRYEQRLEDVNVRNYGRLVAELAAVVPDGLVVFFVSYSYMDYVISKWHDMGVLEEIMSCKLIFIETQVTGGLVQGLVSIKGKRPGRGVGGMQRHEEGEGGRGWDLGYSEVAGRSTQRMGHPCVGPGEGAGYGTGDWQDIQLLEEIMS